MPPDEMLRVHHGDNMLHAVKQAALEKRFQTNLGVSYVEFSH